MKNTTHRVVILKNVNSDMISQAILILKDSAVEIDTNLMLEAERIVEKYMNGKTESPEKSARVKAWVLSAGVALIGIAVAAVARFV